MKKYLLTLSIVLMGTLSIYANNWETEVDKAKVLQLIEASTNGNLEQVKSLLDEGVNINAKEQDGSTALMSASVYGHVKIVKFLIKKGANVNAKTEDGGTALMGASIGTNGWFLANNLVNSLEDFASAFSDTDNIENEKNQTKKDKNFTNIVATDADYIEIVKALIKAGADVNAVTDDGYTASFMALIFGNEEIIQILKKAGAKE